MALTEQPAPTLKGYRVLQKLGTAMNVGLCFLLAKAAEMRNAGRSAAAGGWEENSGPPYPLASASMNTVPCGQGKCPRNEHTQI